MSFTPLTGHTLPTAVKRGAWPTPDQVRAAGEVLYCLAVDIAGQTFRVASQVHTTSDNVRYDSGLSDFSFPRSLDLYSGGLQAAEAKVEVTLVDADMALLWSQGYRFSGSRAELSLTIAGRADASKVVLIEGKVEEPEWGAVGEPIRFIITSTPQKYQRQWPPLDAVVSTDTWSPIPLVGSLPSQSVDKVYPTIINRPGWDFDTEDVYIGSPGYLVQYINTGIGATDASLIMIGGHACGPNYGSIVSRVDLQDTTPTVSGTGKYVRIQDETTGGAGTKEVFNVRDDLGRVCAVVLTDGRGSGSGLDPDDGSHTYQVRWYRLAGGSVGDDAVGIQGLDGTPMTHPSQVIDWALTQAGYGVDRGRLRAAGQLLDHLILSGLIEERVDLAEWLNDNVWPLLPVSLEQSAAGVWPYVLSPHRQRREDYELVEGRNCWRVGLKEQRDLINSVRLRYILDYDATEHQASRLFDHSSLVLPEARRSYSWHGEARVEISSDFLARSADAAWVAGWKIREFGAPWIEVTYACSHELVGLEPGDVVPLTDDGLYLSHDATVIEVEHAFDGLRVTVRIPQRFGR